MPSTDSQPIPSRPPEPSLVPPTVRSTDLQPAGPQELLERIRSLVTDEYPKARRFAAEAARRFPDHDGIRSADRVLNRSPAATIPMPPEPSTDEEFEWLSDPPDSVRGRWVALMGKELVAVADTLVGLVKILRAENFQQRALVHHVEPIR